MVGAWVGATIGAAAPLSIVLMRRLGTTVVVAAGLATMAAGFAVIRTLSHHTTPDRFLTSQHRQDRHEGPGAETGAVAAAYGRRPAPGGAR